MTRQKYTMLLLCLLLLIGVVAGCGGGGNTGEGGAAGNGGGAGNGGAQNGDRAPEDIRGDITVLTNRTDIVDTVFREQYVPRFNEKYPNINVDFEAITDYEGQVKIRMNTKDYGDVLLIPNDVVAQDLPTFFEPLGSVENLSEKYLFVDEKSYEGTSYGIPITVNAQGIVYNRRVFEQAGITELPMTPEAFMAAMRAIKENTDAIPLYTNYAAGWPLTQWEPNRTAIAADPDFVNYELVRDPEPFQRNKPHGVIYGLMYDLAREGLIERDPTTTDWETSKTMMANGEIGAMVLGSWAITQIQGQAENPEDIAYMPFPYTSEDGTIYSTSGGDYKQAVNVNSNNKEAALAWLYWFADESGYATSEGGISPLRGEAMPETLASFEELGVELIADRPAPTEETGWVDRIDQQSEVGLLQPNFKQRIIEAALGNRKESLDDIFADLNNRWARAMQDVTGQ
ncbi:sugar ABC transporter substrate-binding protein [Xylanibacillus composti]|uniref:Sugar ABC transporter substrate-binding protein n=1 Tax=Xylanibacillus composti TaxID=1572762 RepID=A0A8J4H3V4_9BACL|nr:ABC transporter substrate-binding protein [Xylanibacillus composti]GIQ70517.1 sugar ABC transporter substrate-binding protein [Xylanibacillus composti]